MTVIQHYAQAMESLVSVEAIADPNVSDVPPHLKPIIQAMDSPETRFTPSSWKKFLDQAPFSLVKEGVLTTWSASACKAGAQLWYERKSFVSRPPQRTLIQELNKAGVGMEVDSSRPECVVLQKVALFHSDAGFPKVFPWAWTRAPKIWEELGSILSELEPPAPSTAQHGQDIASIFDATLIVIGVNDNVRQNTKKEDHGAYPP